MNIKSTLAACLLSTHFLSAATHIVTSTSNDATTVGTLPYWLLNGAAGDTIDCASIAGEQITLTSSLPAITKSYTIHGAGIVIDGASAYQAFQVASGTVEINNITIQNAISKGGDGGSGYSGGGGAVGGGGALYIHGAAAVTLSASNLLNNVAQGGDGGDASNIGNCGGGGGGGFGGGNGGSSLTTVSTGGGGGGHSNGGNGGSNSSVNGLNGIYFGGGGGGAGINSITPGGSGGNALSFVGGSESSGNGGGGAGDSQNGFAALGSAGTGVPGNGGSGIGADFLFGAGGGGGASSETGFPGASGAGAAGGGGGSNYAGGTGGILGGGGGGGVGTFGGAGGFGAGGGGAVTGGLGGGGFAAGGGNGGSDPSANGGGGGGSGLGGAIFVQAGALLTLVDVEQLSGNIAVKGAGGSSTNIADPNYIAAEDGLALGYDIFLRQGGSLVVDVENILTIPSPIEGDILTTPRDNSGTVIKRGTGTVNLNGINTYVGSTTIEKGILCLNGSIAEDLQIDADGMLSGNARVIGSIHSDGTIKPGNSIGTVTTTDLIMSSTSVYAVEIDPADANLINATGTAQLAGKVQVFQDPGSYPVQGRYTIITTASGLSGSIGLLEVQAMPGYHFSLEQDSHNLYLNYVFLLPPANARGKQFRCKDDLMNVLKWKAPTGGAAPVAYKIYRSDLNTEIGIVSASCKNFRFEDHGRTKNVAYTYYIVAVDSQNNESDPVEVIVKPKI